jgi:hypothetical protein
MSADALEITLHRYPTGEQVAIFDDYSAFECHIPLNDSRTASVTTPLDATAAETLWGWWPGENLLKVRFRGNLIFYGYVSNPDWQLGQGQVVVNCVGPELKLMHHYFRVGDKPVDEGVFPLAGETATEYGFFEMIEAARLSQEQRDDGIPDHLLIRGFDFRGPSSSAGGPKVRMESSDNVWESILGLTDQWDAPDFEFEPIDELHDPDDKWADATDPDLWPNKPIAQFNLNAQNRDRYSGSGAFPRVAYQGSPYTYLDTQDGRLLFQYGAGVDNLDDLSYAQDLSSVRNFVVVHAAQAARRRRWSSSDSLEYLGPYVGWEASERKVDSNDVLDAIAKGQLLMYSTPEVTAQATIKPDTPQSLHYLDDFIVGDFCRVNGRRGRITYNETHRIIGVTISRDDRTKPVQQKLDLAAAKTTVSPFENESEADF